MYAPIVLFVYNRPEHTKRTITALAGNFLASKSDLWIFSDGPKSKTAEIHVSKVRKYLAKVQAQPLFRSVHIVESENNRGLADSIIHGITMVLGMADSVIVLEDDLVTAPDFLNFMNDCLLFYKEKPVGAISGYSPIKNLPGDYKESVYVSKRNCSHGWATWRNRWEGVDWDVNEFDRFRRDKRLRREFDSTGADRFDRLRRQIEDNIDSWSIRFGLHLFMEELVVVYPSVNRVSNIGFDGSGVHTEGLRLGKMHCAINVHPDSYKLSFPLLDTRISRLFYQIYSGGWIRVLVRKLRNSNLAFVFRSVRKGLRRN